VEKRVAQGKLQMSDIDARDFGKLEAQVEALQNEVHTLSKDVKALLELANKSKGGFWMGMTIASTVGGILTYVGERLFK
jgi:DNA anti-recombination protein RmuC